MTYCTPEAGSGLANHQYPRAPIPNQPVRGEGYCTSVEETPPRTMNCWGRSLVEEVGVNLVLGVQNLVRCDAKLQCKFDRSV